ncbi:hypothetical protein MMC30_002941 [Trapelia coarctata]|nr:hypothetical protein [Trapelia coarctata]
MPYARKRKHSAVASAAPIGAPLSTELLLQEQEADDIPEVKIWTPASHLIHSKNGALPEGVPRKFSADVPYAVLVLNQPIKDVELFVTVCRKASYIVAADGGLNRVKDLGLEGAREELCMPNAITGDLDSVGDDVLTFYSRKQVLVVKDSDQYATDFTKSLRLITTQKKYLLKEYNEVKHVYRSALPPADNLDVFVFGGLGGRADQAFSELHHLYLAHEDEHILVGDIYLVTPESIIFLLHKGTNLIHTPVGPKQLGESVGIIPMGRPSIITTKGLEWDVKDWHTEIGGQISTSNHIRAKKVIVTTTEPVLFTVELAQDARDQHSHLNGQAQNTVTQDGHVNGGPSSKRRRAEIADMSGDEEYAYHPSLPARVHELREYIDARLDVVDAHIKELMKLNNKLLDVIESVPEVANSST